MTRKSTYPFFQNITSGSIAQNASATDEKKIGNNEEIVVNQIIIQQGVEFDLEITDQNNIAYTDEALRIKAAGNDRDTIDLPMPLRMDNNETYKFKITNIDSVTATIGFMLVGVKRFTSG